MKRIDINIFITIMLSIIFSSCSENEILIGNSSQCVGSFSTFAYKSEVQNTSENQYISEKINPAWKYESIIPEDVRNNSLMDHKIYGALETNDNLTLWIKSTYGNNSFFMADWMLLENKVSSYDVNKQEWKTMSAMVFDCECIADELFIDKYGNIWAKSAGNVMSEKNGDIPYLSKFDFEKHVFMPVNATINIFSGNIGEKSELMYYSHTIYDGMDNIWIFTLDGKIYKYNVVIEELASIEYEGDLTITSVTYSDEENAFYIKNQKSDKINILGIKRDYEILRFLPNENKFIKIPNIPFYLDSIPDLWYDKNGNLWFDSFGYLDSNGAWVLLRPNYFDFIIDRFHQQNYGYDYKSIISETNDGKIWFYGIDGIAWIDIDDRTGCWDSRQGLSVYEDSNNKIWLVTKDSLYKRN